MNGYHEDRGAVPAGRLYYCDASIDTLGEGTGIAVVVRDGDGRILDAASRFLGGMTNNEAEYEAVILGMELALARRETRLLLLSDSQIVVGQMAGQFAVRDHKLVPRYRRAMHTLSRLPEATLQFVRREQNRVADALAKEALQVGLQVAS